MTILTHANQLARPQAGQIYDYDEARKATPQATFGYTPDMAETLRRNAIRKGEGVTGRAVAKRQQIQVADMGVEGAYESRLRPYHRQQIPRSAGGAAEPGGPGDRAP